MTTEATVATMQAWTRHEYGGPEVLSLEQREVPEPGPGEVRIRVHAASVNPADRYHLLGMPRMIQLVDGLRRPKDPRLGIDVAGIVDAVGHDVTAHAVGDRVLGASGNGYAEVATLRVASTARVPDRVTLAQAATLPVAGATALQGLRLGEVGEGSRVLVNGASGGVGHLAVQLARATGAHVTGVCSTRNLQFVRDLGADEVIDYTTTDYAELGQQWDVLFDNHGNHAPAVNRGVLVDGGRWVIVNGPMASTLWGPMGYIARAVASSLFSSVKAIQFTARETSEDLATLAAHVDDGTVTPHVEREFDLDELPAAIEHLATNRTRGKLLLRVAPGD